MGNELRNIIIDDFQLEQSIKQTKKSLNTKIFHKRAKSSLNIRKKNNKFFQLYQGLYFKRKNIKKKKTIIINLNIIENKKEKDYNFNNLTKNIELENNIPSLKIEKIRKKNFSEEKDRNRLLKYKKLFVENEEKENQLKKYIENNNELLLSDKEFLQSYKVLKEKVTKNKTPEIYPIAITLGGQPGSGKSNIYEIANKRFSNNIVELDCDAFRIYHPYYKQIKHIYGKEDACKTNPFVFKAVDLLIEELSNQKYNLIIESSLKSPKSALENGKILPPKGYKVELHVMATPKNVSWEGTIDRYNVELKKGGNPRAVPKEFHDRVVENICQSLDVVRKSGLMSNILLFNRNKNCIYDEEKDENTDPSLLLNLIINGSS